MIQDLCSSSDPSCPLFHFEFLRFLSQEAWRLGKKNEEKKTIHKGNVVNGHTAFLRDLLDRGLKVTLRTKVGGLGSLQDLGDICQLRPHCPGNIQNGHLKAKWAMGNI